MEHVLIIDSDPTYAKMVAFLLLEAGYPVTTVFEPSKVMRALEGSGYDLIVLDTLMPGVDGLALSRLVRRQVATPIIFTADRQNVPDQIKQLQHEGDDYLGKPFDPHELLTRTAAALGHSQVTINEEVDSVGTDLVFDPFRQHVTFIRPGKTIILTRIETRILHYLVANAGQVVARDALVAEVWGARHGRKSNELEVYINRLRLKLEDDPSEPQRLLTVRGVGYKFQPSYSLTGLEVASNRV